MSYLPSDLKNNLLLSRATLPSHGYPNPFLSSLSQSKNPSKDTPSTAIKPDAKQFFPKNSSIETVNNSSKTLNTPYNARITKDSSLPNNNVANSHNITPTSLNNKQCKLPISQAFHLKDSTHSNETSHTSSTNLTTAKTQGPEPQAAEKGYLLTIESLQRKIEQLSCENKKLSDNISTKSTSVLNKSSDEKEQREKLRTILEEKDKIERNYKQKIDKLTDENSKLLNEISSKDHEIKSLEQKLSEKPAETATNEQETQHLRKENQDLSSKLQENERRYAELEENYKQKLSQFKKELIIIKSQQSHEFPAKDRETATLEKKLENLSSLYEEKKQEIAEMRAKLASSEKNCGFSNKKPLQFSFSQSPLQNSRVSSFLKCNLDDFEEKINNLLQENENLAKNLEDSQVWKQKFEEIEGKLQKKRENAGFSQEESQLSAENDALKRNLCEMSSDNWKIKEKLQELERKFANLERIYVEQFSKKEEELTRNFEKIVKDLEEQKEKNISKISKENHELKQQNDELLRQIQKLSRKPEISAKDDAKSLSFGSSPILIINEMMTPCSNFKEKSVKPQKLCGGLAPISEKIEENSNNSSENSEKQLNLLRKPESLKKIGSVNLNNSSTSINSQLTSQIKLGEINKTKDFLAKTANSSTKNRENANNSATNSSFYKSEGNSCSKSELKTANFLVNPGNSSKPSVLKAENLNKDKKIIMFNLLENHKKICSNEGLNSNLLGNYASNKY